ncbi:MAG: permease-like cell division protein FtsX [Coriobacteriales bacterium]|jgi:cell division transport system permease protein
MAPFKLGYSLREAGHHFSRNLSTSIGAVITIFLSLMIIGLFVVGSIMVNNVVGNVESRITIQAFLADDADNALVTSLEDEIKGFDGVADVTYKSKDQALEEYRSTMVSENAQDAVAALDGRNPLPASLVITLTDANMADQVASELLDNQTFQQVCDDSSDPAQSVQYGAETVDRLLTLTNHVRIIAVVLVVLLIFVAFVFINNTIRLSIMARQTEISIQRLVGASNSFIRGPFVMEGVVQALLGYVLAVIVLELVRHLVIPRVTESLQFLNMYVAPSMYYLIYAVLLVLALVIGLLGSALAMRRYLKV